MVNEFLQRGRRDLEIEIDGISRDINGTFFIGDIHGEIDKLICLLRDETGLIDEDLHWKGDQSTLCFLGDYVDRGRDGIGVIDMVMRLQAEAEVAGGKVHALLGNHDVMILAAYRFMHKNSIDELNFLMEWQAVGGQARDLMRMTPAHAEWIANLPAMMLVDDRLLIHADALFYTNYGQSIEWVNNSIRQILHSDDLQEWSHLLDNFAERYSFYYARTPRANQTVGTEHARFMLNIFGGKQIVHGHTPISIVTGNEPRSVRSALLYAHGLCLNVDGGMYRGSPGFIHQLQD